MTEADMKTKAPTLPIAFPKLKSAEAATLNQALMLAGAGARVHVAVTYKKQTTAPSRVPGADYIPIKGIGKNVILGRVVKVAVGGNGPYILLDALTRRLDVTKPGWTAILPDGVQSAQVLGIDIPLAPRREVAVEGGESISDEKIDALSDELLET
jgi:hypothetical protein